VSQGKSGGAATRRGPSSGSARPERGECRERRLGRRRSYAKVANDHYRLYSVFNWRWSRSPTVRQPESEVALITADIPCGRNDVIVGSKLLLEIQSIEIV
jgi:hypothetical protein